jgi:hypothetical protein
MARALAWEWATRSPEPWVRRGQDAQRSILPRGHHRQIVPSARTILERRFEDGFEDRAQAGARALHPEQSGTSEEFEGHLGRNRIPGETENQGLAATAENEGSARLHLHRGDVQGDAEFGEGGFDEIEVPCRDATRQHDRVVTLVEGPGDGRARGLGVIFDHAEVCRRSPGLADRGDECRPVGVADLGCARRCLRVDDFVPGHDDGHPRLSRHNRFDHTDGSHHRELRPADANTFVEEHRPLRRLGTLGDDVLTGGDAGFDEDVGGAVQLRALDLDHGIRALWHRSPGHDAERFTWPPPRGSGQIPARTSPAT